MHVWFLPIVVLIVLSVVFKVVGVVVGRKRAARAISVKDARNEVGVGREVRLEIPGGQVAIAFEGISYVVVDAATERPKLVLDEVSGAVEPGEILLLMGPSGCGKSTLLNALCGLTRPSSGSITANGVVVEDMASLGGAIGFVPQEDIMLTEFTVEELLLHSARTRLPSSWSEAKKRELVNDTIAMLRLEHRRHSRVGGDGERGVSGGERKRVSIGIEVVSAPQVLFLDEPTSGLDATSSKAVIESLKRIARATGMAICAVLHQPRYEIVDECDKLLLLAKGGKTVFFGPVKEALPALERLGHPAPVDDNPADFLLEAVSLHGPELVKAWRGRAKTTRGRSDTAVVQANRRTGGALAKRATANVVSQYLLFLRRSLTQLLLDQKAVWVGIILQAIVGLAMGTVASQAQRVRPPLPADMVAACPAVIRHRCLTEYPSIDMLYIWIFFFTMADGAMSAVSGTLTFGQEANQWRREARSGASTLAYFLARNTYNIFHVAVDTLSLLAFFYLLGSPRGSFGDQYLVFFALGFTSYSIGYLCSFVVPGTQMIVAAVIGVGSSIFSGTYPNLSVVKADGFLRFFWSLIHTRWAGEAIAIADARPLAAEFGDGRLREVLAYQGIDLDNFPLAILYTFLIGFFLRAVGYLLLRRSTVVKKTAVKQAPSSTVAPLADDRDLEMDAVANDDGGSNISSSYVYTSKTGYTDPSGSSGSSASLNSEFVRSGSSSGDEWYSEVSGDSGDSSNNTGTYSYDGGSSGY